MAKCPNCGRATKRTEDWCCQWCGYPLLSGSYKKIPKTYRELKEERLPQQPVVEEAEPEPEAVVELEVEPEPEPEAELEAEPEPELEAEPKPKAKRKSVAKRKLAAKRKPAAKSKSTPAPEPATEPKSATKRKAAVRPEPVPEVETEPAPVPEVETEPAPAVIEITVEELLSAYSVDGEATDARFFNQVLRITGVVDRIEVKVALDIYYITLSSAEANVLQNVRCTFDRTHGPELEQLIAGQTLTVQGRYDGSMIDMRMRNCFLVS